MRREFLPVGAFRVVLQLCAAEFCLCKGRSGEEHRLLLSSEECSCCRGRAAAAAISVARWAVVLAVHGARRRSRRWVVGRAFRAQRQRVQRRIDDLDGPEALCLWIERRGDFAIGIVVVRWVVLLLRVENLCEWRRRGRGRKKSISFKVEHEHINPRDSALTLTAPFSPMRYDTSPGSTQTESSAGKFSRISAMGTPLSRAAISNTTSIGSPVFRHRKAEPWKNGEQKALSIMSINHKPLSLSSFRFLHLPLAWGELHAIKRHFFPLLGSCIREKLAFQIFPTLKMKRNGNNEWARALFFLDRFVTEMTFFLAKVSPAHGLIWIVFRAPTEFALLVFTSQHKLR